MHDVWLIARREYIERIRTRGFLITTVLIPIIMGGFIFGSSFLGSKVSSESHIAIVSSDLQPALDLQDELERPRLSDGASGPRMTVDVMGAGQETRAILDRELDSGDLDGYLWIAPAATPGAPPAFTFTPRSGDEQSLRNSLASAIDRVLLRERMARQGMAGADLDAMLQPVQIATVHAPHRVDREAAEVSVTVLFFLMYMVCLLYTSRAHRTRLPGAGCPRSGPSDLGSCATESHRHRPPHRCSHRCLLYTSRCV